MDQVRQRLNEIRRKQLELQSNSQTSRSTAPSKDKSQFITALVGIAAGVTIAVIAWLANSLLTTKDTQVKTLVSRVTILENEFRKTNVRIDQLNDRVELLADSISSLETQFTQVMELASTSVDIETKQATSSQKDISETDSEESTVDASSVTNLQPKTENAFVPTHTVKTRLNLRSSASLEVAPIALLEAGTKVRYIDKEDGWYYVDTASHGKGWCASEYLSRLPSP